MPTMINPIRTDLYCHNCSKNFIAQLDFGVNGNHVVECPYCGHEHCREIRDGVVTNDRWSSRSQRVDVEKRNVWKSAPQQPLTCEAAG